MKCTKLTSNWYTYHYLHSMYMLLLCHTNMLHGIKLPLTRVVLSSDWLSNTTSNYGECSDKKPSTTFLTDTLTKAEAPVPDRNWTYIMIFLFGNIIVGVVVAIFLNIRDAQTVSLSKCDV